MTKKRSILNYLTNQLTFAFNLTITLKFLTKYFSQSKTAIGKSWMAIGKTGCLDYIIKSKELDDMFKNQ
ncbi:hypothetical protein BpHYR1_034356 [Brachionus plicatilis]|uniref:Uncharacterized protein n=1 Tax=Brachionus plicatilis TaxID=10195 RepID=A0A3M7PID1_BRAPC|nr:hypothetical protein BpHYR1_034356 [Brachionus plicatilis]